MQTFVCVGLLSKYDYLHALKLTRKLISVSMDVSILVVLVLRYPKREAIPKQYLALTADTKSQGRGEFIQ